MWFEYMEFFFGDIYGGFVDFFEKKGFWKSWFYNVGLLVVVCECFEVFVVL